MSDLQITATQSTPAVKATQADGRLEMRGDSYPENSFEFFSPIMTWVNDYLSTSEKPLSVDLHLLYLNTSSVKIMMDLFDTLEDAHGDGREVKVRWYYDTDNERIAELAEEFKEDCTFAFNIVAGEA